MSIFRTIKLVRKIISLAYKVSKLTKRLEKDVARARKGRLKPRDVRRTFLMVIGVITQIENEAKLLENHVQRTMGPEISALMAVGGSLRDPSKSSVGRTLVKGAMMGASGGYK